MKRSVLLIGIIVMATAMATPAAAKPKHKMQSFSFSMGHGRLGVEVISISEQLRTHLGAPKDAGILVNRVEDKTAAKLAGVRVGDIIVDVDGDKIASASDVHSALSGHKKGDKIKVIVVRAKKRKTLTATLKDHGMRAHLGRPNFRVLGKGHGPKVFDFSFGDEDGHGMRWFGPGNRAGVDKQLKSTEKRLLMLEKRLEKLEKKK